MMHRHYTPNCDTSLHENETISTRNRYVQQKEILLEFIQHTYFRVSIFFVTIIAYRIPQETKFHKPTLLEQDAFCQQIIILWPC